MVFTALPWIPFPSAVYSLALAKAPARPPKPWRSAGRE
jgi:hypothetical protein